jgi:hypothetical protein
VETDRFEVGFCALLALTLSDIGSEINRLQLLRLKPNCKWICYSKLHALSSLLRHNKYVQLYRQREERGMRILDRQKLWCQPVETMSDVL